LIKINDILTSSNSKFRILDIEDRFYLAEQTIKDKVQAYEVGTLRINRGGFSSAPLRLPSPANFGIGKYDKTFTVHNKMDAVDYFNSIKNNN